MLACVANVYATRPCAKAKRRRNRVDALSRKQRKLGGLQVVVELWVFVCKTVRGDSPEPRSKDNSDVYTDCKDAAHHAASAEWLTSVTDKRTKARKPQGT
jgi:hypothetical protein